ncbi:MAG: hypothetical protein R3336_06425, partial [Phycisphaeraceae bacterium]|nr:hypothetical protein [Phycisphaeraceae bacterium]
LWYTTPPPMPETAEEAMATLTSARYQRLPDSRKEAYLERAHKLGRELKPEKRREMWEEIRKDPEKRKAMRQVQVAWMLNRAEAYAKAPPAQREAMIKGMVAMSEMARNRREQRRQEREANGDSGGQRDRQRTPEEQEAREKRRAERRQRMEEFMHKMIEEGNPQRQAYATEFVKAFLREREAMGLENP